jgi:hypothetical protein
MRVSLNTKETLINLSFLERVFYREGSIKHIFPSFT